MKINLENSSKILDQYQYLLLKTVNLFPVFETDEALDEAREVTMDAIESYDEDKAGFGGYLKYRLYYHFLDKSKEQRPDSLNDLDKSNNELVDTLSADVDIERDLIEKEEIETLYEAIKTLSQDEKILILLKYVEGKSHKEIAEICGLSPKTITNRHYKIIKKLRKKLERGDFTI